MQDPGNLGSLLRQCCERQVAATLLAFDSQALLNARFVGIDEVGLAMEIRTVDALDRVAIQGVFCVTFRLGGRCRAFLTVLDSVERPAGGLPRFRMRHPWEATVADSRTHLRLPVAPEAGLRIEMLRPVTEAPPLVVDLSLGGMQVQFRPRHDPKLTLLDECRTRLTLGGEPVELTCVVRWGGGGAYGVSFLETGGASGTEEEARLRTLLGHLDAFWIRQRGPAAARA